MVTRSNMASKGEGEKYTYDRPNIDTTGYKRVQKSVYMFLIVCFKRICVYIYICVYAE